MGNSDDDRLLGELLGVQAMMLHELTVFLFNAPSQRDYTLYAGEELAVRSQKYADARTKLGKLDAELTELMSRVQLRAQLRGMTPDE